LRLLPFLLGALALAPSSLAAPSLGIFGDPGRFHVLTGQESSVHHVIVGWGQGQTWGSAMPRLLSTLGPVPMVGFTTAVDGHERITPRALAQGAGDSYLIALNAAIAAYGHPLYVRPMPEMNGHWNVYCAYTASGRSKGRSHSTAAFRNAFARIYVVLHGGPAAAMDARLRRLGLPPVGRDLPVNPPPTLKVVWNPQGYGSPDVAGNTAQAYYPGDAFVDVVGDDLYDIGHRAEWAAAEQLYRTHPRKPFAFPEWGLWGIDDPSFVQQMAQFARTHPRLELLSYYDSKPGSIWDLGSKPRSLAVYRSLITPLGA
jgi:hypothetical protein